MFTANLTVRAITQNLEIAVELSKKEVVELYRQFLTGFWVVAARTLSLSREAGNSLKTTKNIQNLPVKSILLKKFDGRLRITVLLETKSWML